MGFFDRLANIWKGFISLWISDVENKNPDAVYESAPTLVFLKAAVPNKVSTDSVRFLVRSQELPPTSTGKPPPPPAPAKDLYARTSTFTRPK